MFRSPSAFAGILELRADSLAVQEALHSSMLGRKSVESPETTEEDREDLDSDELDEGEDLEEFEDDNSEDEPGIIIIAHIKIIKDE